MTHPVHIHHGHKVTLSSAGKCWWCGGYGSQAVVEGGEDETREGAETEEGDDVENNVTTLDLSMSVDAETGELPEMDTTAFTQPTLSDELFPATWSRQVPMVKLSVSGTVEMSTREFQSYCSKGLQPGREVTMTVTGYLPDPHPKWVKRKETVPGPGGKRETVATWELEGQIKVKVTDLDAFELGEELYSDE